MAGGLKIAPYKRIRPLSAPSVYRVSSSIVMLLYAASALLLLNALTTLAREDPFRKCEDHLDEGFCQMLVKRKQCNLGSYAEYAERNCFKTCGYCTPVTPKPKETCVNKADAKTCYDLYERGQCEVAKDICAKTCYFCDS
ncbi:hypothetical protein V3C99_006065 [Haemonchus contortus]